MDQGTSYLIISGLQIECFIGIYDFEKNNQQNVSIDIEIDIHNQRSFHSDNINDAVDYSTVVSLVKKVVKSKHFNLVEHLAEEISSTLFAVWDFYSIKVAIGKVGICSDANFVGVKICRFSNQAIQNHVIANHEKARSRLKISETVE